MNKDVVAHLKIWLLQGNRITHNQALRMWKTNRLAEFIRRLRRDHGMKIITELVSENGSVYGVYYLEQKEKVSRIKTTLK
jgi:hypothetical protein